MKKVLVFVFVMVLILLTGCQTQEGLTEKINQLKVEKNALSQEVRDLNSSKETLNQEISKLQQTKQVEVNIENGIPPMYILTLEVKQSHFSLDLEQHLKDAMNKTEFNITVDKRLYDEQEVGSELLREFRGGSFFMSGSMGDWVVTVVDKQIK